MLCSASYLAKKVFFPAKFVIKLESELLSELEAFARMGIYNMFSAAV